MESKDFSLLIDPFSKEIGLRSPRLKDSLILLTHHHYDHANLEGKNEAATVIDGPGEYEISGIYVRGVQSFHDATGGTQRGLNTIYIVKMEEISLCHLGDLGQEKLEDRQLEDIGNVDVLMIPVGGKYTIGYKEAAAIVGQIEPKIIVPMHYKVPGLKIDIEPVDKFLKEIGLTPERVDKLRITPKTLPVEEMQMVLFNS